MDPSDPWNRPPWHFYNSWVHQPHEYAHLHTSLTELKLLGGFEGHMTDKEGVMLAQELQTNTKITTVNIRGNDLTDKSGQALAQMLLVNTTLKSLDVSNNKMKRASAISLANALEHNTVLRSFKFNSQRAMYERAKGDIFLKLLKVNTTLQTLGLRETLYNDEEDSESEEEDEEEHQTLGMRIADALKTNNTLTSLDLGINHLYMFSDDIVGILKTNTNLLHLDLTMTGVWNSVAFAKALEINSTLRSLDLDGNSFTEALPFANALKINTTLTKLHLWNNPVSDPEVVKQIDALLKDRKENAWKIKLLQNRVKRMREDTESIGKLSKLPRDLLIHQILISKAQLLLV